MITFVISLFLLVAGYFVYGRLVERVFRPDGRTTPAVAHADGVDYIVLPSWKIFMIQFLNIAGTGPIFGAIMGAKFGPAAYIWIVAGCIFAGAVHDYLSGMLSLRNDGASLPELVGMYLGRRTKAVMLAFTLLVMLMVGAVFVYSPAIILGGMSGGGTGVTMMWVGIIFVYYVLATMLPIDKVIGRIYPVFAVALLFMAVALMVRLLLLWPADLPEIWDIATTENLDGSPVVPCLCITIACGAISGFHATQSPLMARCMKSERMGRPVFYGAMITEGVVALIWATIASWFFYGHGAEAIGSTAAAQAPQVVTDVANGWLGTFGGILALLGVVAAPITSGDTAFRSARLIMADFLRYDQKPIAHRLYVSLPLFAIAGGLLWFNIADPNGFNVIWGYFAWSNQTLSCFTLWTLTVFLSRSRKPYALTLVPALLMTSICTMFLLVSKNAFGLSTTVTYFAGAAVCLLSLLLFLRGRRRNSHLRLE